MITESFQIKYESMLLRWNKY